MATAAMCSICYYSFNTELPHLSCTRDHPDTTRSTFTACQPCFYRWIHGDINSDNVGFRQRNCACGAPITYELIEGVLSVDQFEEYNDALTRRALETNKSVIYCPGPDCVNAFLKPKRSRGKRQCRRAVCDECETVFCCRCGELYTAQHQRMKCGPYKKWKQTHDEDTISLKEWKDANLEVKKCPGCKRDVEKSGGCREMRCTNCSNHFCWTCMHAFDSNRRCGC